MRDSWVEHNLAVGECRNFAVPCAVPNSEWIDYPSIRNRTKQEQLERSKVGQKKVISDYSGSKKKTIWIRASWV